MTGRFLSAARTVRGAVVVAIACAISACASGGAAVGATPSSGRFAFGFMVPGSAVASALRISATDTLAELTRQTTVSSVVTNAISAEVATGRWNNGCTRRFGGPTTYAVIFHRACDAAAGPEADPAVIVGFGADGRVVGRVPWSGPNTVTTLNPTRRF
jgi:hypothetical protein